MVIVDGIIQGLINLNKWTLRQITGASAPIVEIRGYDATTDSVKVISGDPAVTFLWKEGTVTNPGDVITWIAANTKRAKVLLWWCSATATSVAAFRENTGTIGTPTWTTRMRFNLAAGPGVAIALPEQFFGPTGDGAGAVVKVEALSGTATFLGGMHGFEV